LRHLPNVTKNTSHLPNTIFPLDEHVLDKDNFATGNAFSPPWAALLLVLTKMSTASVEENAWNGGLSKGIADIAQRDHDENVLFLFHEH